MSKLDRAREAIKKLETYFAETGHDKWTVSTNEAINALHIIRYAFGPELDDTPEDRRAMNATSVSGLWVLSEDGTHFERVAATLKDQEIVDAAIERHRTWYDTYKTEREEIKNA
jgi:hypothetical protein